MWRGKYCHGLVMPALTDILWMGERVRVHIATSAARCLTNASCSAASRQETALANQHSPDEAMIRPVDAVPARQGTAASGARDRFGGSTAARFRSLGDASAAFALVKAHLSHCLAIAGIADERITSARNPAANAERRSSARYTHIAHARRRLRPSERRRNDGG